MPALGTLEFVRGWGSSPVRLGTHRVARGKRIIVLDDDTSVLEAVKRVLEANGFDVEVFDTVEGFLSGAGLGDASCLVLDIDLNGTSGIELKRQLTGAGISVPVVFITGADKEASRQAAREAGYVAYLEKPFPSSALIEAIEKIG